jgi:hypothetical protein
MEKNLQQRQTSFTTSKNARPVVIRALNSKNQFLGSFVKNDLIQYKVPTGITQFFEKLNLGLFGFFFSLQRNTTAEGLYFYYFLQVLETLQLLSFPFKQSVILFFLPRPYFHGILVIPIGLFQL